MMRLGREFVFGKAYIPFSYLPKQSKKEAKYQESIQSRTTPDPGHRMGNVQNIRKHHIQECQKVSPFPTGDIKLQETDMAVWQRQTQTTDKIHKGSTSLERSVRKK